MLQPEHTVVDEEAGWEVVGVHCVDGVAAGAEGQPVAAQNVVELQPNVFMIRGEHLTPGNTRPSAVQTSRLQA